MDNYEQLREIFRFHTFICKLLKKTIPLDTAAELWINLYAKEWRERHGYSHN